MMTLKSKRDNSKILDRNRVFTPQIINDVKNRDKNGQTELTKEYKQNQKFYNCLIFEKHIIMMVFRIFKVGQSI